MDPDNFIFKIIQKEDIIVEKNNLKEFKNFTFVGISNKNTNSITKTNELSLLTLSQNENSFECIFLHNPFNNTENFRELFVEINRIMRNKGVLICIFDEQNIIKKRIKWQLMYLDQLCITTGFEKVKFSFREKFQLRSFQKNKKIILITRKNSNVKETYSKKCHICGKPLGKEWHISKETNESIHNICPSN